VTTVQDKHYDWFYQ